MHAMFVFSTYYTHVFACVCLCVGHRRKTIVHIPNAQTSWHTWQVIILRQVVRRIVSFAWTCSKNTHPRQLAPLWHGRLLIVLLLDGERVVYTVLEPSMSICSDEFQTSYSKIENSKL